MKEYLATPVDSEHCWANSHTNLYVQQKRPSRTDPDESVYELLVKIEGLTPFRTNQPVRDFRLC
jgi:hypothetical protein